MLIYRPNIMRKLFISLAACFFLLGGGALAFAFLVVFPAREAQERFAEGERALERGRPAEALEDFKAAYDKHRKHPNAGFAYYDLLVYADPDAGASLLDELADAGLDEARVRARQLEEALRANAPEEAAALAADLSEEIRAGREVQLALLRHELSGGGGEEGLSRLNDVLNLFPEDPEVRLLQAQILYGTGQAINRVRAKHIFSSLLSPTGTSSFRAANLMLLLEDLPVFPEDLEESLDHLVAHPFFDARLDVMPLGALRQLVVRAGDVDAEKALPLAEMLLKREGINDVDRSLYIAVAQAAGATDRIPEVRATMEDPQETLPLASRVALIRQSVLDGQMSKASADLLTLMAAFPDSAEVLSLAVTLLTQYGDDLNDGDKEALLRAVIVYPESGDTLVLQAWRQLANLKPEEESAINAAVRERFEASQPALVGRWFLEAGNVDTALEVVSEAEALSGLDLFSTRFDALLRLERLDEAAALIHAAGDLLGQFESAYFEARLAALRNDAEAGRKTIQVALETITESDQRSLLFDLAAMASGLDLDTLEREVYTRAFEEGLVFPQRQGLRYLELLLRVDDLETAKAFAGHLRNLSPDNPIYINNDAYLATILERDLQDNIRAMRTLVETYPEATNFRITLALAQLLAGFEDAAMKTLDDSEVSLNLDADQSKFAFALVLAGSGQRGMARNVIDSVNRDTLLSREQQLLDRFLFAGQ